MAGAIGLKGIHTVTGICDLCGSVCNPDKEELNALDCTYKDCPPMVYHQDCLEKYLKSIRLEKNRKTGFKCPRGCGKGTSYPDGCRGKIDKSHPIHVRHDAKRDSQSKHRDEQPLTSSVKKAADKKAPSNIHDVQLIKLVPPKAQSMESQWSGTLQRSKSLDKSHGASKKTKMKRQSRRSASSIPIHACPITPQPKSPKPEVGPPPINTSLEKRGIQAAVSESGSGDTSESIKPQEEIQQAMDTGDQTSESDSGNQVSVTGSGEHESEPISPTPPVEEASQTWQEIRDRCRKCIVERKTDTLVQQLNGMGFETWRAMAAVHLFGSNVSDAIQWLVENGDIDEASISALLQNQAIEEVSVDFELRSLSHACRQYQIDALDLEKAVVRYDGDVTSAIDSLAKTRPHEWVFPDCDLSLGIVYSESPRLHERQTGLNVATGRYVDYISDDLMLGGVLGSALEEYTRGQADFTDIAAKDLRFYERYASPVSATASSPLSRTASSPSTSYQEPIPPTFITASFNRPGNAAVSATSSILRHFIGDILE